MTITNGYATLDQLSERLGFDSDKKTRYTTMLEDAIEEASRMIDNKTNSFFFTKAIVDEIIDCNAISDNGFEYSPSSLIIIAPAPIISVSALEEAGVAQTEITEFDGTGDFFIKKGQGYIFKGNSSWSRQNFAIKLSCSIGYAGVPEDIRSVCLAIAKVLTELDNKVVVDENGNAEGILQSIIPAWTNKILRKYERPIV